MKLSKKAMISLLSIGGISLAGVGVGVGYAIHQPQTIDNTVTPPQPFWIQLTHAQNGSFTLNKNDISNILLKDKDTINFDYHAGSKKLKYEVTSRDVSTKTSRLWINPFQIFLNKDSIDTTFDFWDHNGGDTFNFVIINITEL